MAGDARSPFDQIAIKQQWLLEFVVKLVSPVGTDQRLRQ